MGCFDRLEPLKRRIGQWRPSWTRTGSPRRGRETGLPTNFRKESDPFASMTNVIHPRASTIHELPSMHDMGRYTPATTTMKPAHRPASPDLRNASVAELPYHGLPMSDVSSTARLIERNPTPA